MRNALAVLVVFSAIASAETTYTRDVARIIQVKCQQCHRPNDVAPFALMSYDDAVTYAADIKTSLNNKTMPPWKPVPGFNNFADSFALTDDQRLAVGRSGSDSDHARVHAPAARDGHVSLLHAAQRSDREPLHRGGAGAARQSADHAPRAAVSGRNRSIRKAERRGRTTRIHLLRRRSPDHCRRRRYP